MRKGSKNLSADVSGGEASGEGGGGGGQVMSPATGQQFMHPGHMMGGPMDPNSHQQQQWYILTILIF
jgi:hypothetical protein